MKSRGTGGESAGWTRGLFGSSSGRPTMCASRSRVLNWPAKWTSAAGTTRARRSLVMDLPHGKLRLKHLVRREGGSLESTLRPIRAAGESNLTVADLDFFELHVLPLDVRRITHEDHGIAILTSPFDVNSMVACMLDDPVKDVVGRDRQDSRPNLLESELDGVPPRDPRTSHHGDHRLNSPLPQLKGESDPVQLKQDARLVDFRRKLVGEIGDEILGQPGVHFLIGEDGFPTGLVADVVAELEALSHKFLGSSRTLFSRQANHGTIIGGLVGQAQPEPPPESRRARPRRGRTRAAVCRSCASDIPVSG